jgi:polyisoprenoid-binding protein YceI
VTGDLTLHGVTREVSLKVENHGTTKDPWGKTRLLFAASTHINRKDFGLGWNQVLETGGVLVSDKIEIEIDLQAVKAG